MKKIARAFYRRPDVLGIARELIGKVLVTRFDGVTTTGRIVETEAYMGIDDRASHAFGGRRTDRTAIMYEAGGVAYVYLCYGVHHLFNVVTHERDVPHAVLLRALEPLSGVEYMCARTGKKPADRSLCSGPGNLSRAMGIDTRHTGLSLGSDELHLAEDGALVDPERVLSTPRIGVDYAGEDALLPYRFILANSQYLSGRRKQ